ncbi:MAG: glycoside hydrolase family 88 protein [Bacteroidetes bacterium]|nr:glycoside hydrolase family 88 protein [Bacteroidota bacterium]
MKINIQTTTKMKYFIIISLFSFFISSVSNAQSTEEKFVKNCFDFALIQNNMMMKEIVPSDNAFPRTMKKDGSLYCTDIYEWTSGFYPGILWYLSEYSGDASLQDSALKWTEKLEPLKTNTSTHDIGFMMYCSYGNAYRITKNEKFKQLLVQSADALATRFNPKTGVIKSWDGFTSWHDGKKYYFPVIIDNMMNLELLFFASKVTGNPVYKNIAIAHATTTMKNHIRKDYSSFHVILYDTVSGKPIKGETAQGYADNSTWSRGESWGIYGFTMVYRETGDAQFLKTACGMADYFLNNKMLPSDKIPYWDFNANMVGYVPGNKSNAWNVPVDYRDASAAAITASALFELSTYCDKEKSKKYLDAAKEILHALSSPVYRAKEGTNADFILMHSTGSIPHNSEIDVPLVYADYYYIEALHRYQLLLSGKKLFDDSQHPINKK